MTMDPSFRRHRPHPWHGLEPGAEAPDVVTAYIEITPFDLVKYEVDKATGYLKVDRPQRGSSSPPTLYGFIPRTYCAARVAALAPGSTAGDGDPLDICVISERPIARSEILLRARVVGGLQMIDASQADDKIVAVLTGDYVWGNVAEMTDLPAALVERLEHYFLTYKLRPGREGDQPVRIARRYDAAHAREVIRASMADYAEAFGTPD
ncbi:MAG TPA: inorganic pyrophosphatase [Candidatus Eisenbacteria bacterium]